MLPLNERNDKPHFFGFWLILTKRSYPEHKLPLLRGLGEVIGMQSYPPIWLIIRHFCASFATTSVEFVHHGQQHQLFQHTLTLVMTSRAMTIL